MPNISREQYAKAHTTSEPALLQELAEYTQKNIPGAQMLCGRVEGRLLQWLVKLVKAQRVLELGTYTGYSALSMAEGLPETGQVVTCDKDQVVLEVARQFIARSEQGHKIQIIQKEALDFLHELVQEKQGFDFIFIDANKKPYKEYVEQSLKLLNINGMIAVDNTFLHDKVLAPQDELGKIMAEFNASLLAREDVEVLFLPIRDGITLIRKRVKE